MWNCGSHWIWQCSSTPEVSEQAVVDVDEIKWYAQNPVRKFGFHLTMHTQGCIRIQGVLCASGDATVDEELRLPE